MNAKYLKNAQTYRDVVQTLFSEKWLHFVTSPAYRSTTVCNIPNVAWWCHHIATQRWAGFTRASAVNTEPYHRKPWPQTVARTEPWEFGTVARWALAWRSRLCGFSRWWWAWKSDLSSSAYQLVDWNEPRQRDQRFVTENVWMLPKRPYAEIILHRNIISGVKTPSVWSHAARFICQHGVMCSDGVWRRPT